MKRNVLLCGLVSVLLSSCSTFNTVDVLQTMEYMESSARVLEADHNMLLTPLIADLNVSDKKITYTEREMFADLDVTRGLINNIVELKKIALSRAARAYDADVLVGSTIDIVTEKGHIVITVSGYPAQYVKFRKAEEQDIELLKKVYGVKTVDGTNVLTSPSSTLNIKKTEKVEL